MGASMAAGVGVGIFKDFYDAADQYTNIKTKYFPSAERHIYYQRKFEMYCRLIDALDPIWSDLSCLDE